MALIDAAGRGDLAQVEALLAQGVPVDAADGRGRTALIAAAYANQVAVAERLIAAPGTFADRHQHRSCQPARLDCPA
jgi:hypothetical protein